MVCFNVLRRILSLIFPRMSLHRHVLAWQCSTSGVPLAGASSIPQLGVSIQQLNADSPAVLLCCSL